MSHSLRRQRHEKEHRQDGACVIIAGIAIVMVATFCHGWLARILALSPESEIRLVVTGLFCLLCYRSVEQPPEHRPHPAKRSLSDLSTSLCGSMCRLFAAGPREIASHSRR